MAGIAGIISNEDKSTKEEKVKKMLSSIKHRGRKSRVMISTKNASYGLVSHSDIDKSVKDQKTLFDGKIFNIDKLLKKYDKKYKEDQFNQVGSLIENYGPSLLKELKGSYALVSSSGDSIYLARDTIGKKPLYYSLDKGEDSLVFASEIKALVPFADKIKEMPPGAYIENAGEPNKISRVKKSNHSFFNEKELEGMEKKLEEIFLRSVEERIPKGDNDIGVWLSGGVDSSIIAALVRTFRKKVYTFSVGFKGCSDLMSSRVVASHIDSEHVEHHLSIEELFDIIPKVIYHLESFDAPLVRSSLGNMLVSKISSGSDFVFSGEGGDEVFGGYNYFLDFKTSDKIQEELLIAIDALHNTALQRVDRLANAYGVNVRLPMLDEELIHFALKIPTDKKVRSEKNITKYILRKLASKYLPYDIAWRTKEKFWEGSGITDKLTEKIESLVDDKEFEENRILEKGFTLRNKEEYYYYKIFKGFFPNIEISDVLSFTKDFPC
jgi:asparagine synthase (glutamine-hydrolysing)